MTLTSYFELVRYFSRFVSGNLTCVLLEIYSLCLIDKSLIFKTHGFVTGRGGPDHQSVSVTAFLQSQILVNDLTANSHNVLVPLPEHDEPLQLVDIAGEPHRVALVDEQDLRVCLELRCRPDLDLVVIVTLDITIVILLVIRDLVLFTVRRT